MSDQELQNLFGAGSTGIPVEFTPNPHAEPTPPEPTEGEPADPNQPRTAEEFAAFKTQYQEQQAKTEAALSQLTAGLYMLLQQQQQGPQQPQQPQQAIPKPINGPELFEKLSQGDVSPLAEALLPQQEAMLDRKLGALLPVLKGLASQVQTVQAQTQYPDMGQTLAANKQRVEQIYQILGAQDPVKAYQIIKSEAAQKPQPTQRAGQRGSERPGGSAGVSTRIANSFEEQVQQEFAQYQNGQQDFPVGRFKM